MANHPSAAKRYRQSLKRQAKNQAVKAQLRTVVRKAAAAVSAKEKGAGAAVHVAVRALYKASSKHVLHKRRVSRKVSRLMRAAAKAKLAPAVAAAAAAKAG